MHEKVFYNNSLNFYIFIFYDSFKMDHEATNVIMAMLELKSCRPTTSSGIKSR